MVKNQFRRLFSNTTNVFFVLFKLFLAMSLVYFYWTNLPLWLDTRFGTRNAATFYALLLIFAAVLFLKNPLDSLSYLRNKYFIWCTAVLVLFSANLLRLLNGDFPLESINAEINRIQIFLIAPAIGFIITRLEFKYLRLFLLVLPLVCTIAILYDFLNPGALNPINEIKVTVGEGTRVAGPWRNSNLAGEATVLSLLISGILVKKPNYLFAVLYTFVGLALIATGSRAGLIGYFLCGVFLLFTRKLPLITVIVPILIGFNITNLLDQVEIAASYAGRELGIENLRERLDFLTGAKGLEDKSSESRRELLIASLLEALSNPFSGHAVEYYDVKWNSGSHNMATWFFYSYGVMGFAVWAWLAILILYSKGKLNIDCFAAAFAYIWFSMFTHNMLASIYWLIFFALFSVYFGNEQLHSKNVNSNSFNYTFQKRNLEKRKRRKKRRKYKFNSNN